MELHLKGHENLAVLTGLGQVSILVDVFQSDILTDPHFLLKNVWPFRFFA